MAKELLHESGSVFVQISDENVHHVREILDEIFGSSNFVGQIAFIKTAALIGNYLSSNYDYILWYSKSKSDLKYRQLFIPKKERTELGTFSWIENSDGTCRRLSKDEMSGKIPIHEGVKRFRAADLSGQGETSSGSYALEFQGETFFPSKGRHWTTNPDGMKNLIKANRIIKQGTGLAYKRFEDDYSVMPIVNVWDDTIIGTFTQKIYVVQTGNLAIQRCILMSTDPGDIVLDITCGSGTTANVAEQWGRRWMTCDTSRVALSLAKQRILTSCFDFYQLSRPEEGIASGFKYQIVPHITLGSIANNEDAGFEILYDQPNIDTKKIRITGPFTVESIPAPIVKDLEGAVESEMEADKSVTRTGETLRQDQWRDELQRTGVRAKGGAMIEFNRIEAISGTRYIQAQGETKGDKPEQVLVVFGPEHAPLEQRMVELAIDEARYMKPDIVLFCAFQFDDEAAKDIDEIPEASIGFKLLKAQMNMDLQTEDLKKKRNSNQSFWLIGQPDVRLHEITEGEDKGKFKIEVMGFDYFNPKTGNIESGGKKNIAMWMLDSNYDGRSLFPKQVFFPMAGTKDGWGKLAKNLKAEIDEEKIEAFRGTVSLPFEPGKQIAVKIIDDRGIESLKIITQ